MNARAALSAILAASLTVLWTAGANAQSPPTRAYYWNIGDGRGADATVDAARISRFGDLGVSEVHVWLNENAKTKPCDYRFGYVEGGARLWTPARLESFTRSLKDAGIKPVFIFSPDVRTRGYIASLAEPSGPLAVAARIGGVDVELDIEGNGDQPTICPGDGLTRDQADQLLIDTIRATTPASKIVISSTLGHVGKHPVLTGAADAISPQLYGAHYAYTLKQTQMTLDTFMRAFPAKPMWVGLSVECSVANAAASLCSRSLFDGQLRILTEARAHNPALVPKYVVWGEREAKPCPGKPLCSVYSAEALRRSEPTAVLAVP